MHLRSPFTMILICARFINLILLAAQRPHNEFLMIFICCLFEKNFQSSVRVLILSIVFCFCFCFCKFQVSCICDIDCCYFIEFDENVLLANENDDHLTSVSHPTHEIRVESGNGQKKKKTIAVEIWQDVYLIYFNRLREICTEFGYSAIKTIRFHFSLVMTGVASRMHFPLNNAVDGISPFIVSE